MAQRLAELTGQTLPVIHIIGGGSQNALLNQFTVDTTGRTVLAGPMEATALGNVLVQALAAGDGSGALFSPLVRWRAFVGGNASPFGRTVINKTRRG